jgi:hypothetical protein
LKKPYGTAKKLGRRKRRELEGNKNGSGKTVRRNVRGIERRELGC